MAYLDVGLKVVLFKGAFESVECVCDPPRSPATLGLRMTPGRMRLLVEPGRSLVVSRELKDSALLDHLGRPDEKDTIVDLVWYSFRRPHYDLDAFFDPETRRLVDIDVGRPAPPS